MGPVGALGGEGGYGVRGGFLSFLRGVSYQIRNILMYRDVSCMYPACILKDTRILSVS